jgi:hypothetical protein
VTLAVIDDHLLRDLLSGQLSPELAELLDEYEPATTNLYFHRLCRSVVAGRGRALTGWLTDAQRQALGRSLLTLPGTIEIVPMRVLAYRMAELASVHGVSTLGAEAIASAEHLRAPLCVWAGDDGPRIRSGAMAVSTAYRVVRR